MHNNNANQFKNPLLLVNLRNVRRSFEWHQSDLLNCDPHPVTIRMENIDVDDAEYYN